jgi:hypothetical protein
MLILTAAAAVIVVVIVAAYFISSLNSSNSGLIGRPVTSAVYSPLYNIAMNSNYGPTSAALVSVRTSSNPNGVVQTVSGQPFTSGGKPILLYIGGEFCPLCGFQRWPMVIALMRFGNFSNLEYMQSASDDSPANVPTFTFLHATYSSQYVVFESYEQEDRARAQLQTVPNNYTGVFSTYGSDYPFLDFANKYVVVGALYAPDNLVGLNWTQIVRLLGSNSNSQLSVQVMSAANAITALICKVTGGVPSSVCGNSAITSLTTTLAAYYPASNASLIAGAPSSMAVTWASVQYRQMAWSTDSSTKIR